MRQRWPAGRAAALAVVALAALAGCGSAAALPKPAPTGLPPVTTPLATTLVTQQGTWAVLMMGKPADTHNSFWQVLVKPAGSASTGWQLVTPPGVADNGGLVTAGTGSELLVGFRPSADLVFSPLASSGDVGRNWTPDVLNGSLASVPDALAATPAGQRAALLTDGTIDVKLPAGTWTRQVSGRDLEQSEPGQRCGVRAVGAVSYWTSGELAVGVDCTRPGVAGIFLQTGGGWLAAGPALPDTYAGRTVSVLRLGDQSALLQAGPDLLASWGQRVSTPLTGVTGVLASGFWSASPTAGTAGQGIWVLLADGRAALITPGGTWQLLPKVPDRTAVIVPEQGQTEALAASGSTLTVWRLAGHGQTWAQVQQMTVPITYGSSG